MAKLGLRGHAHRLLPTLLKQQRQFGVSRLINATPMDRLGIPVVSAMRPNAHDRQITVCQGKGRTLRSAAVGALMEAVERHCAATPRALHSASINALKRQQVDFVGPAQLGIDWAADAVVDWVEGHSLDGNTAVFLPASEMLFPYTASADTVCPVRPSTTGIASGSDYNDALFHALLELVERYATSLYRATLQARLVDVTTFEQFPVLKQLLDCFTKHHIDWFILDLSESVGIPVFMFISHDPNTIGPNRLVAGQAAHIRPERALESAILECAQSRIVALQASREDLDRHAEDWSMNECNLRLEFEMIRCTAECSGHISFTQLLQAAPAENINSPKALCRQLGLNPEREVHWLDLSPEQLAVKVVSVRADGFVDFYVDPRRAPYDKKIS